MSRFWLCTTTSKKQATAWVDIL